MALVKCPRCELNYILDGGALCTVCRREVRGEQMDDDVVEMCSECGENPVVPGAEYCASCLKEMSHRGASSSEEESMTMEDVTMGIDNVSTMDEIVIDETESPFDTDEDFDEDEEEDESQGGKQKKPKSQDDMLAEGGYTVIDGDKEGSDDDLFDR